MIIKAFLKAYAELKQAKREARLRTVLFDDPLTIELLKKIASDYQYTFEIHRPDGTVLRFLKRVEQEENEGWGV